MDNTVQALEQRIAELEKQLKSLGSQTQRPNVSAEEMATFKKVGSQLGYDFTEECGVNECQPVFHPRRYPWWRYYEPPQVVPIKFCYECQPCWPGPVYNIPQYGLNRFGMMG